MLLDRLILIKEARRRLADHARMTNTDPIALGIHLEQPVPRYASYPSPASFHDGVGGAQYDAWLKALEAGARLAVYVHIPFCERLCWYCSCRTQTIRRSTLISSYLDNLLAEIERSAALLPAGSRVERVTWGGGSPTSLAPWQISRLAGALSGAMPLADGADFAVEVDPASTDEARLDALAEAGMTRAIISVQDFAPQVQAAIGRSQSRQQTEATVARLRARGVTRIAVEQLYGLPLQAADSVGVVADAVSGMAPETIRLVGYAHVPWLAKRQRMIAEESLPDLGARLAQFEAAAGLYRAAGFEGIGTDTFSRPDAPLALAARAGRLRRGFDGYLAGPEDALLGFGAGAISRLRQGYVQNHPQTRAYEAAVAGGSAAAAQGIAMTLEDKVRARAIEMLMCGFKIDLARIRTEFGDFVALLEAGCAEASARYGAHVARRGDILSIERDGPVLARLVARLFDARITPAAHYGMAV
jgi:oxygen-independent coproporphyrinogen III oxidase